MYVLNSREAQAVALAVVLGGIGFVYVYYAVKENRQDAKERLEVNRYYSLAAL